MYRIVSYRTRNEQENEARSQPASKPRSKKQKKWAHESDSQTDINSSQAEQQRREVKSQKAEVEGSGEAQA